MEQELQVIEIALTAGGKKIKICYSDSKIGDKTVIFLHGFGSFFHTFDLLKNYLDTNLRFISVDIAGCQGFSDITELSEAVREFIKQLKLDSVILVGHSSGAACTISAAANDTTGNIEKIILISPLTLAKDCPEFISQIATYDEQNPLVRYASEDIFTYIFLKKAFFNERKITSLNIRSNADMLKNDGIKEKLISFARKITPSEFSIIKQSLEKIKIPTLIIYGAEDELLNIDDAYLCYELIPDAKLELIQQCGHLVHEEMPEKTAGFINKFIASSNLNNNEKEKFLSLRRSLISKNITPHHHVKLRNMVEKWSFGALLILIFMKFIQFLRFCGLRANENGWRKASGIFLQKEQSKFILGSFYLKYYRQYQSVPFDLESAKSLFIHRISEFLRKKSSLHWAIEPTKFGLLRKKSNFNDIVEAQFASDGTLLKIIPSFDRTRDSFHTLTQEQIDNALDEFVNYYNKLIRKKVKNIPRLMSRHMKTWIFKVRKLGFTGRFDMLELVERLLTASFINFEILSDGENLRKRFATPNLKIYHHPGWGLLNMIVRFAPDFSNADLWVQYHHVPVDGLPMQEILGELKQKWGAAQELRYPPLTSHEARPEVTYCGNSLFRGRVFADFSKILTLRKEINEKYSVEMSGPATLASMLMWGLCQHDFFRNAKILFPVDIAKGFKFTNERELGLLFIRPTKFFNPKEPLNGFIKYAKEFNMLLNRTRSCKSESYEMMELYSMVHPVFYYFAKNFMPGATSEYLGTVGISIMREAEMFLAPFSDIQSRGFMSVGNLQIPTTAGELAGAVSICGTRREIKAYIEAISDMTKNYNKYLNI